MEELKIIPIRTPVKFGSFDNQFDGTITALTITQTGVSYRVCYCINYWMGADFKETWLTEDFFTVTTINRQKIGFKNDRKEET